MASPAALATQHHRKVELIADTAAHRVTVEARKAGTADIDAWWARRGGTFEQIVGQAFDLTAGLAGQWLTEAAGLAGLAVEPVAAVLVGEQLQQALRIVGPVGFKTALTRTKDADKARQVMGARLAGTTRRLALAGSRDTLFATADAAPQVVIGYRREAEAGACKFCEMLAGRGAVYLSSESSSQVVGRNGRARGTRKLGRAFHDNCRCRVVPEWGQPTGRRVAQPTAPPPPAGLAPVLPTQTGNAFELIESARARSDRLRRKAKVDKIRADAAAERAARLDAERSAATGGGKVDPALLRRWGVTEDQYLNARAITKQIKSDIRRVAGQEADNLGGWLLDNDLSQLSRPDRLRKSTNALGQTGFRRQAAGYDWMEQLDDAELARVRKRMVDGDLHRPDLLAEHVRRKVPGDMTDDEAMAWVVDRWLHEDALRSLASGRIPKYADAANLIPGEYALDGYDVELLFGQELDDAVGHVAQVQARAATEYADRALGNPTNGPAPWELDAIDYVGELDEVEAILANTQIAPGIDPGPDYRWAQARIRELAPAALDDGRMAPNELYELIRVTAQQAGRLTV